MSGCCSTIQFDNALYSKSFSFNKLLNLLVSLHSLIWLKYKNILVRTISDSCNVYHSKTSWLNIIIYLNIQRLNHGFLYIERKNAKVYYVGTMMLESCIGPSLWGIMQLANVVSEGQRRQTKVFVAINIWLAVF